VSDTPARVSAGEIAHLLAWARSLIEQGRHADLTERAAYQDAKTSLLARITAATHPTRAEGGHR
jgi:hypothetical protein